VTTALELRDIRAGWTKQAIVLEVPELIVEAGEMLFLAGPSGCGKTTLVRGLARESIGFELREQDDVQVEGPTGAMMNNILHPTRILLVGPDRRLIGVYWYNDDEQIEKLISDARNALG